MSTTLTTGERRAAQLLAETRHEEIARRAFELWEQSGRPRGSAEADWLAAERQIQGCSSMIELPEAVQSKGKAAGASGPPQHG